MAEAASALKAPPTDLTALAQRNGGKFPAEHVSALLTGKAGTAAHGSKEMPVWGPIFWKMSKGHPVEVQQRVSNLTGYLQSIQTR